MCTNCHVHHEATARIEHDRSAVDAPDDANTGDGRTSRRAVLGGVATAVTVGVGGLAGCLDDDEASAPTEPPDPVALGDGRACDACGMVIADHGGPNGQVFYAGDHPPDRDGPAWYDSLTELVTDRAMAVDRGRDPVATYVTDYAAVEYEITEAGGGRVISSHVAAASFVDWDDAVFAVETGVVGAMGPDAIPFSERPAAESFVDAEGGRVVEPDAVTVELVSSR
ncbi:nitrous oxide reductase accessory protein NosL [Halorubrum sp. DTA46]|uniref:nitrous oxide reductase accessory protein NosL n=1 Tax=Halorubrum sp. DTA46 TaxID=3402162 RepID=UPI003AAA7457